MTKFSNSYIITARNTPASTSHDNIIPLPGGAMWYYTASGQYNNEASEYSAVGSASPMPSSAFLGPLGADLQNATQLTVIVHGLGNLFIDSITEMARLGSGLQQEGYGGLVVSFDWPSYDMFDSSLYYASSPYSFPPPNTSGTVRDNINGTVPAFGNFLIMLQKLVLQYKIPIDFICHSEGAYMMMLGMSVQSAKLNPFLNQVLLAAGDINVGALQQAQSDSPQDTGQGLNIINLSERVTVYYSTGDDVLPWAQSALGDVHNPSYPGRLGLEGPSSFPGLPAGVYGVDCSAVVLDANQTKVPQWPAGISSHSSYFYIPQVLQDWAQTLVGTPAASVVNRVANGIASNGFVMQYVAAPSLPLPRGRKAAA